MDQLFTDFWVYGSDKDISDWTVPNHCLTFFNLPVQVCRFCSLRVLVRYDVAFSFHGTG